MQWIESFPFFVLSAAGKSPTKWRQFDCIPSDLATAKKKLKWRAKHQEEILQVPEIKKKKKEIYIKFVNHWKIYDDNEKKKSKPQKMLQKFYLIELTC